MQRPILLGLFVCLTACSAPQGEKLTTTGGLAPVASGPPTKAATLTYANRGEIVSLRPSALVTVKLPSSNRDGYEWRFDEVPDPSVLKLVSKETVPSGNLAKPGEQTLTFEAVGPGDVAVKLWYGTLWASPMNSAQPYDFIVSVSAEEPKPAKKSGKRAKRS